jgi:hypothetical protein
VVQVAAKVYSVVADVTIATYVPSFVHRGGDGSGLTTSAPAGAGRRRLLLAAGPAPAPPRAAARSLLQASGGSGSGIAASLSELGLALQAALNATGVSTSALSPTDVDYAAAYAASLLAGVQYLQQATDGLVGDAGGVASAVMHSYGEQSLLQDEATDSLLVAQLQSLMAEVQLALALVANRTSQAELLMNLQAAAFTDDFSRAGGGAARAAPACDYEKGAHLLPLRPSSSLAWLIAQRVSPA